jgi:hypothetical protein
MVLLFTSWLSNSSGFSSRLIDREKKLLYLNTLFFQPLLRFWGTMDWMSINCEKYLPLALAAQPVEKFKENRGGEPAFGDHEV